MNSKCIVSAVILITVFLTTGIIVAVVHPTQLPAPFQTPPPTLNPSTNITPNSPSVSSPSVSSPSASSSSSPTPEPTSDSIVQYTYTVVKTYPHDTSAFTQGLVYDKGSLFESTGGFRDSSLRKVVLESGVVIQRQDLPNYFCEGLTIVNDTLVQLTWQTKIGFIYDKETFSLLGNFSYATEGWGLTFDGSKLIMSDGSSKLTFLDPLTYQKIGEVNVLDGTTPITNINELEYINGDIYANIWLTQKIVIINPQTGQVKGWIDLTGINPQPITNPDSVLNGIAYDQETNRLFVTGKNWPNLYQIELKPVN
ncbi:glutaminyl-peptide cyclotransferase [Candidatus Bathycorpusculum sp.]|jgi:glutamine cyclotransferase|uniref:glutaminyl-peptide cyclotransferase n=1 Tax=Candidatus Bathycorpusculum sp. TaxID=2994959 RepID=UPI002833BF3A|nr:glutaminyl-peptide cyclotransferase [Candidatus Termitimicrobium sp.]